MKYKITLNGKIYEVEVEETDAVITNISDYMAPAPAAATAVPAASGSAPAAPLTSMAEGVKVLSPMPGIILSVNVQVGQHVKAGDVLLVLEAMKMENEIVAAADGVVRQVFAQKGSTVDTDAVLVILS